AARVLARAVERRVHLGQDAARRGFEFPAFGRELDVARAALEQPLPQRLLQRADQRAERGLREMAERRGAGEVALLGEDEECPQLPRGQIHLHDRSIHPEFEIHRLVELAYSADAMPHPPSLHLGCAAGFSGDRTDAAGPVVDALIATGGPSVLIFETLAERTLALAQLARRSNPAAGYEPLLDELLRPVLARCLQA